MPRSPTSNAPGSRGKRALLALGAAMLLATSGLLVLRASDLRRLVFVQSPGPFHRSAYEAVVDRARAMGLSPGETRALRLDDLHDPATLRLRRPGEGEERGQGAGNVWAQRAADGTF